MRKTISGLKKLKVTGGGYSTKQVMGTNRQMTMNLKLKQSNKSQTLNFDNDMGHVINIEDFDPVYRKKEFQNIKKYAMDILDLRKSFTQQ